MIPLDSFMAHSADGRLVPVVPGGQNISLTFMNRTEYVEKALDYRLHEMDSQVCQGGKKTTACRSISTQLQEKKNGEHLLSLISCNIRAISGAGCCREHQQSTSCSKINS